MSDISQYDIDSAVSVAVRTAERDIEDLRNDLERRISDLESTVYNLRRQPCPCQGNDNCP